jgi:hypothetical protein
MTLLLLAIVCFITAIICAVVAEKYHSEEALVFSISGMLTGLVFTAWALCVHYS